jgi:hypothetical protein
MPRASKVPVLASTRDEVRGSCHEIFWYPKPAK